MNVLRTTHWNYCRSTLGREISASWRTLSSTPTSCAISHRSRPSTCRSGLTPAAPQYDCGKRSRWPSWRCRPFTKPWSETKETNLAPQRSSGLASKRFTTSSIKRHSWKRARETLNGQLMDRWRQDRFHQVVLLGSLLLLCWLLMQVVHEAGHVLAARISGAEVERIVLHPLSVSRTD